jgi:hypothetical protein
MRILEGVDRGAGEAKGVRVECFEEFQAKLKYRRDSPALARKSYRKPGEGELYGIISAQKRVQCHNRLLVTGVSHLFL